MKRLLAIYLVVMAVVTINYRIEVRELKESEQWYMAQREQLLETVETQQGIIETQRETIDLMRAQSIKLTEEMERQADFFQSVFMELFMVEEMEITGYAPLDPNAVEGVCFSGDPSITASGEMFVPGSTAAATLPYGTRVFVPGFGWYTVRDRGGAITDGKLDLGFATRGEALRFGRQKRLVLVVKEDAYVGGVFEEEINAHEGDQGEVHGLYLRTGGGDTGMQCNELPPTPI